MRPGKVWSKEDEIVLSRNWFHLASKGLKPWQRCIEIGKILGRTPASVRAKAVHSGLDTTRISKVTKVCSGCGKLTTSIKGICRQCQFHREDCIARLPALNQWVEERIQTLQGLAEKELPLFSSPRPRRNFNEE